MTIDGKQFRDPRKKSLQLFYSTMIKLLDNYSDEEVGTILRAVALYEMYGEITEFSSRDMKMLFQEFADELDRNMENYIDMCERNKENRNKYKQDNQS